MSKYKVLMSNKTLEQVKAYKAKLVSGERVAGEHLQDILKNKYGEDVDLATMNLEDFVDCVFLSKQVFICAEASIIGDGSDWNYDELQILADINCAVPCTVFDNGIHNNKGAADDARNAMKAHEKPFSATLLFTPSALLKSPKSKPCQRPDRDAILSGDPQKVDQDKYNDFYENKLLSILQYANDSAAANGKSAFITMPGLGAGVFGAEFSGVLPVHLKAMMEHVLTRHKADLPNIKGVYFDSFNKTLENDTVRCGDDGPLLLTRPLAHNPGKSQLLLPADYNETCNVKSPDGNHKEEALSFDKCELFSIVAWDHGSWPGNDYYKGVRQTDDGVKGAATSSMAELTGTKTHYNHDLHYYEKPKGTRNWGAHVEKENLELPAKDRVFIPGQGQLCGNNVNNDTANNNAYLDRGTLVDDGSDYKPPAVHNAEKVVAKIDHNAAEINQFLKKTYNDVVGSKRFNAAAAIRRYGFSQKTVGCGYNQFIMDMHKILAEPGKTGTAKLIEIHEKFKTYNEKYTDTKPGYRDGKMLAAFDEAFEKLERNFGKMADVKDANDCLCTFDAKKAAVHESAAGTTTNSAGT